MRQYINIFFAMLFYAILNAGDTVARTIVSNETHSI